jgi:hypothetical protein
MKQHNLNKLQGGADDDSEELQYRWRSNRHCTAYEHRGTSSLTPAQVMGQQTSDGYAWMCLVQGMNVLQLMLLHLKNYLRLQFFLGLIGHSKGNYASVIHAQMLEIKEGRSAQKQSLYYFAN